MNLTVSQLRIRRFWGVFWIDVSTATTAETMFLQLAHALDLSAQTWEDACLRIANLQHPWLLILDNADDPHMDYQPYFPNSPWGTVIMTSRNEECHHYATTKAIELQGLSGDAARELLMKAARVPADQYSVLYEDATRVAALLQSHPLALIQAGAYVARGNCQMSQYPTIYTQQRQRLLEFHPAQAQSRYRDVYATFEASADALKQLATATADDALQLLPAVAAVAANPLPLVVFEAAWKRGRKVLTKYRHDLEDDDLFVQTPEQVAHLPPFLNVGTTSWDSFRLTEAFQLLKAFALVTTDTSVTSMHVSMHPLVHAWARDRQNADEQHQSWLSMACIMALAGRNSKIRNTLDRQLQVHFEALVQWEMDMMFANAPQRLIVRVLLQCGWMLNIAWSHGEVQALVERLIARLGLDGTKVERAWMGLYELEGCNLSNRGIPEQGVALLEQVVGIKKKYLAAEDLSLLELQHSLARAYRKFGQTMEAIALLEMIVEIEARKLVVDNLDRLRSQEELAAAYKDHGQVEKAVSTLEDVARIRSQTLAADDTERLASQHALASMYHEMGRVAEALALIEEVVSILAQTAEEDDPSRLSSENDLAVYLWGTGQREQACQLIHHVVERRRQVLAEDDHRRLCSEHELAVYQWGTGKRDEAHKLMGHVVECRRHALPEDHPERLNSQEWLDIFRKKMGAKGNKARPDSTRSPARKSPPARIPFRERSKHAVKRLLGR